MAVLISHPITTGPPSVLPALLLPFLAGALVAGPLPGRASLPVEGRGPLTSPVQSRRARRCYSYQAEPLAKLHPRHERDLASDLQASAPVAPRIREQILQERIPPQISAIKIPPQTPLPIHFPSPLPWVPHQDPRETHPMQVGNYRGGGRPRCR